MRIKPKITKKVQANHVIKFLNGTKYILIVLIFLGIIQTLNKMAMISASTNRIVTGQVQQSQQIKELQKQNNKLAQENHDLAQQNQLYLKCNFLAFASFTRTGIPIKDSEINSCDLPSENANVVLLNQSGALTNEKNQKSNPNNNNGTKAATTSGNAGQNPAPSKQPLVCKLTLKLLGC